jgi:pimeloyl-ACP methyl ester carboxylesterase
VYVRDQVTRYHRRGAGRPVLLLADAAGAGGAPWPALDDALAARFRTIRPELPAKSSAAAPPPFADWLRDFLDGIGVEAAAVVAAGRHGAAALDFSGSDADRVERVLVVADAAPPELAGALAAALADAPAAVPVLVVAGRDGRALAAALAFLGGGA